jgi:hypothetical protein
MAHTISERKVRLFLFKEELKEQRRTAPQRRRAAIEAKIAVAVFNVRARSTHPVLAWPTFRAALLAGRPILVVQCPSCEQVTEVDLRRIKYHPDSSINSLTPHLKCLRCQPDPPLPRLMGLRRTPRFISSPGAKPQQQSAPQQRRRR